MCIVQGAECMPTADTLRLLCHYRNLPRSSGTPLLTTVLWLAATSSRSMMGGRENTGWLIQGRTHTAQYSSCR